MPEILTILPKLNAAFKFLWEVKNTNYPPKSQ